MAAGANFGCGSTREHACWALDASGIRVLIAGSFGEVFRDNCIRNGILPIAAAPEPLERLRGVLRDARGPVWLQVDLVAQQIARPGFTMAFELPAADRTALLDGLDEIGMTMLQGGVVAGWEDAEQAVLVRPTWASSACRTSRTTTRISAAAGPGALRPHGRALRGRDRGRDRPRRSLPAGAGVPSPAPRPLARRGRRHLEADG